jgi:uncharacterized protein (DUF486 family)
MLIYLAIIITLLFVVNLLPILLGASKPSVKPLTFENDILFLNYIISISVRDYEKYVITPAKAAGRSLMSDEDLNKYRENIVIEIYSEMSQNYVQNLMKYFSPEGLRFYISNTVNNELTSMILKHNSKFFNNMYPSKTSSNDEKKKRDSITKNGTDLN